MNNFGALFNFAHLGSEIYEGFRCHNSLYNFKFVRYNLVVTLFK